MNYYKMTSSTSPNTLDYLTDNEDNNEDIEYKHKLISNNLDKLSSNIYKWSRTFQYKYLEKYTKKGTIRKRPITITKSYDKIRYIIKDTKYRYLEDFEDYNELDKDDLIILLDNQDNIIRKKDNHIEILNEEVDKMTNKFKWSMAQAFKHGFRYR